MEHVVDGDTIEVVLGDAAGTAERESTRIRLLNIDTPETVDPNRPPMCYGSEASNRLKALLPEGAPVHLTRDRELTDKFGRVLAYVYRDHDGLFVNLDMVEGGFATPLIIEPNHAHATEILDAAARAKAAKLGAWSVCPEPFEN